VHHDGRFLQRSYRFEVEFLSGKVSPPIRLLDLLGVAEEADVSRTSPGNGNGIIRLNKDCEVPVQAQFRAVQEDALEDEDRVRTRLAPRLFDGRIGAMVEPGSPVTQIAAGAERKEKIAQNRGMVERILVVPARRVSSLPVSNLPWMMKAIDGSTDHFSPVRSKRLDEFVGQGRLPRSVDSVDTHSHRVTKPDARHPVRQVRDHVLPPHRLASPTVEFTYRVLMKHAIRLPKAAAEERSHAAS
jgi:hypothetical protein